MWHALDTLEQSYFVLYHVLDQVSEAFGITPTKTETACSQTLLTQLKNATFGLNFSTFCAAGPKFYPVTKNL